METIQKKTHKFYQNLGKLFYAVAASDKQVSLEEFDRLKQLVKSQWLHVDPITDNFGTDAAYQIEIVFDWLESVGDIDVQSCFDDFVAYKNDQKHLFTPSIKKLIKQTARAIAAAFSGINKAELIILAKLDMELKK